MRPPQRPTGRGGGRSAGWGGQGRVAKHACATLSSARRGARSAALMSLSVGWRRACRDDVPPPLPRACGPNPPSPPLLSGLAQVHKRSAYAQKVIGLKAKLFAKQRHSEKVTMKKTIAQHSERDNKHRVEEPAAGGALPAYLLDREQTARAKVLSNTIKQKRKEKAGKWEVPLPKVRAGGRPGGRAA